MGGDKDQIQEISNNKLMEVILDIQKNLNKNTDTVSQIMVNMEDIKKQQEEIKKEFLSFKTNTQASIKALEVSQQKLTESQQFINVEFEVCKSNQKTTEERAKFAEAKIVNLNAQLQSFHETLREEQNRINDLEQYGRHNMIEISNIPIKKDKNLQSIITALAKSMEVKDFTYEVDVDVAHRLNSKLTPPPVIVMFHSRTNIPH